MKPYTKKILNNTAGFAKDSVKGTFTFLGDLVKLNSKWLLVLLGVLWFWDNRIDDSWVKEYLQSGRSEFKEGEVAKLRIDCRDNTGLIHRKGHPPERITGLKVFDGSQFEDGTIKTHFKNKGIGLEPGITVTSGDGLRLGLDVEYAYWKRFGLLGGATLPVRTRSLSNLRGHLGLSYDLPSKWFSHSSLWAGLDTNKTPLMGWRTKFGGGI